MLPETTTMFCGGQARHLYSGSHVGTWCTCTDLDVQPYEHHCCQGGKYPCCYPRQMKIYIPKQEGFFQVQFIGESRAQAKGIWLEVKFLLFSGLLVPAHRAPA